MMFEYGWAMTPWGWAIICIAAGSCVVLVGAIYWITQLFRRATERDVERVSTDPHHPPAENTHAEQILAERFAKGELDDSEYASRLRKLREPLVR